MTMKNLSPVTPDAAGHSGESTAPGKEVYQKPRLGTVDLAAEQVLGIGCKVGGSASGTSCSANVCFGVGTS
jgi:hypothetical protein